MTDIKVNDKLYPAVIDGNMVFVLLDSVDSNTITLTMTHAEVAALLPDNTPWSIVQRDMVDVLDEKVAFAKAHGFAAVNSRSGDLEQQVRAAFDGKLADVAFEGTGFGSALNNAIDCVRPFATVVMVGNPAGDTTIGKVQHSKILRKELTINGIWNSHFSNLPINEWRYTVDMLD